MSFTTLIGLAAGFLATAAFLPQVVKTWQTKRTKDLSLGTFVFQGIAVILWFCYGLITKELPMILWNVITAVLVFIIVAFKLKYK